jgi:hypothetical protein
VVHLIGTLSFEGEAGALEYRMLEGSCGTREVIGYLDALAEGAEREGRPVVVVLGRAPFHLAGAVRERRSVWEAKGLRLYYLPAYCPHLNPIEGVVAQAQGLLDAEALLRLLGGVKAGRIERLEPAGGRGASVLA